MLCSASPQQATPQTSLRRQCGRCGAHCCQRFVKLFVSGLYLRSPYLCWHSSPLTFVHAGRLSQRDAQFRW